MSAIPFETPIVYIIFNRPEVTKRSFSVIKAVQPKHLFVVADGPRAHREDDLQLCAETRAVIHQVDWDCEVTQIYSDINLGCGGRISSGLTTVFEHVDKAIVLEDDCLPHLTFFDFCHELLEYYQEYEQVMHISGSNFQLGQSRTRDSYYFSRYPHCWGWATWRRAWCSFDFNILDWPTAKQNQWLSIFLQDQRAVRFWEEAFDAIYRQENPSLWSYQWLYSCWRRNGLTIIPNVNLVSNVGYGAETTHAFSNPDKNPFLSMESRHLKFPIRHPQQISRSDAADRFTQNSYYHLHPFRRLQWKLARTMKRWS